MEQPNTPSSPSKSVALVAHPQGQAIQQPYYVVGAPYGLEAPDESDSGGGLLEYWHILRRHKKGIAAFAFCGMLLGFLAGLPFKPVYKVTTSLEILNLNDNFMDMKGTSPVTTNDFSYDTSEEETQVQLLQSEALVKRVINRFSPGLLTPRKSVMPAAKGWRKLLDLPEHAPLSERDKLLLEAAGSLKVKATPRTRIVEVTVKSTDPQLAVDFANTLANEFIEQNVEARWKSTQSVGDWLSRELNDERAKLEHSEDALQTYARDSGLIFTDSDGTSVQTEKLQQVQQQLTAVTADRIAKESRYELAQHASPDSLPDVLNDDNLRDSAAKVTDLRRQIADFSAVFTPDYSKVKRLQAELAAMEAAYQHDRADILDRVKNDYDEALRKEKLLALAYDAQTREVTGQDEKAVQYNILKREVESHRQLYDTMLQQMKQSSIASALHASNVRVVDPAELPNKPVWPDFKILSAAGLFSGFFMGLTVALIRERSDRSLQQPGDAQLWTNLPELGTIPSAAVDGEKRNRKRVESISAIVGSVQKSNTSVELITWDRKPSLMAEAFRSTLTSILFVGENGSRPRVLVFTSANASDGKTTVVSNLAIAMAEIRHNVLVIDADLRRPRVHDVFNIPNERGLSDLLREQTLGDENINALIRKTEIPGLEVLPSGPSTHAAANLLYSPNFAELLTRLRKQYDMVLIDTPPMLQMTDARVVGRLSDAVILVARAEQTTRDALVAASQRFSEDRTRVLGTILNCWDPKRAPAGYYGYYKGSYYSTYRQTGPVNVQPTT